MCVFSFCVCVPPGFLDCFLFVIILIKLIRFVVALQIWCVCLHFSISRKKRRFQQKSFLRKEYSDNAGTSTYPLYDASHRNHSKA